MKKDQLLVGLDIGTTKIACIVAEKREHGLEAIGVGTSASQGMRKGVVNDIGQVIDCITKAVQEAETMCAREIRDVYTGISGSHITGQDAHGQLSIVGPEITENDVVRVINAAQTINISPEREIIYVEPQEFIVDGQGGIREPVGMVGKQLEAKVHVVSAAVANATNLTKACNSVGLNVRDIILQPMAGAVAVLTPDEMEMGVCLVDIGGGTTDVAVYINGSLNFTHVIDIGGNQFTSDLAIGLSTPKNVAHRLKEVEGCVHPDLLLRDDEVEVMDVSGQTSTRVKRKVLVDILGPRGVELFSMVRYTLEQKGWLGRLPAGIVLTGGGAQLQGMQELASDMFETKIRIGSPQAVSGLGDVIRSPTYATAVGLLVHSETFGSDARSIGQDNQFSRVLDRMKSWFTDIFS